MLLLALLAVAPAQAEAFVRIRYAQPVTDDEWLRAVRKREIVIRENGRTLVVRLIELE